MYGPLAILDFESRSRADLRVVGGRLYWQHDSTEALCAVIWRSTETFELWLPGEPAPQLEGYMLAAHNAFGFDRFAAARSWSTSYENPARWIDTSELAKRLGMRGSLDALGAKDTTGSKYTKALSSVRRPSTIASSDWRALSPAQKRERGALPHAVRPPAIDAQEWRRMSRESQILACLTRVVEYCVSDVEVLVSAWPYLSQALDVDADVGAASVTINDRGAHFDRDLANLILVKDAELTTATISECASRLELAPAVVRAIANSPAQFTALTGSLDARASTVAELAELDDAIGDLARARQALASIVRGKVRAGLARCGRDGRIRDLHTYYGGHTGRYSGSGFQAQNLTRPTGRDATGREYETYGDAEFEALAAELTARPATPSEIDALLRPLLCAARGRVLVAVDWTGIESRVLAWCAHDLVEIDNIEAALDPYKVAAAQVYGVRYDDVSKPQRQVGKVVVLATGYGGGSGAISRFADTMGIDLDAVGVTAEDAVRAWRAAHQPIVRFWYALEGGFRRALHGEPCAVGDFHFYPATAESGVAIALPSGRPIIYRDVRESTHDRRQIVYESREAKKNSVPDDAGRLGAKIYGGLLAENVVQATCRCILARALVECERRELPVVMHVHDEIVVEVPETIGDSTYAAMVEIMCSVPDWARSTEPRGDCPLAASGWIGRRYHK